MIVIYPSGQSRQFYQQNAIFRSLVFVVGPVGPHAATQRAIYTVPAGRRALVGGAYLFVGRITAAAPVGLYSVSATAIVNAVTSTFAGLSSTDNTVLGVKDVNSAAQAWLAAGDSIALFTADGSTGGTVDYNGTVFFVEFDA